MSFDSIYGIAASAMRAQTVRLDTVASNLANVDSAAGSADAAYKAVRPVFQSVYQQVQETGSMGAASVMIADVVASQDKPTTRYEPNNPLADADGNVYYANINTMEEMADMMSASRSFESSIEVLKRIGTMQQGLLGLADEN
ncbi:flagellar basal-body rod protein FlgC [Aeromonas sp. RU39B]|jgi:flagellar basal-body rod protein FlgC|uniref:flagellar basal body rod protein FlgC n=1 Tax=Aeromonas sp. RU39B TaxID=1907416 RepID=UPI0009558950|nr:flagellar basal body rod protein FlgC [Aeromonas sp. RU39B]SIR16690.1 flagellar basal-body rod protein FlgC [Aeromonas sp. RU39B]